MRQPCVVLVFPFRVMVNGPQYAIFQRADDANWQSVSGGVEDDEDMATAARRETVEETGRDGSSPLYKLDMVSGVEKTCFAASAHWSLGLYIVPKHFFGMDVGQESTAVALSDEHRTFWWLSYDDAYRLLRYDDDRTALWELDARIRGNDLPEPVPLPY